MGFGPSASWAQEPWALVSKWTPENSLGGLIHVLNYPSETLTNHFQHFFDHFSVPEVYQIGARNIPN